MSAEAPGGVHVRPMSASDADQVMAIYSAGIDTGNATFETATPPWSTWDGGHLPKHRYVAVEPAGGRVLGWAALSPVSERCVYAGVAEVSVYVHPDARGRGVGRALLARLIDDSEAAGFWTLQAGIFPENVASLTLHGGLGFRLVGRRERLGQLHGVWRDVLLLERRSRSVG